ncbi:MAG: hypothetical protein NVSMB5_19000 [Candidatus Velthaea sp.]
MVITDRALEVRPVGVEHFDQIMPLLELFGNPKMSRQDWRDMLFAYPWWDGDERGFALFANGVAVGFLGTVFSRRRVHGRDEVFCNLSSWIVREEYRSASIMLLKAILGRRDCTFVNLTPTERSYEIFAKLGFKQLESSQLILAPLASPAGLFGASCTVDIAEIKRRLPENERSICEQAVLWPGIRPILLESDGKQCLILLRKAKAKRLPVAEVLHVSDTGLFWRYRSLVHVAAARAAGALSILIDARFANGHTVRWALKRPVKRSFRSALTDLHPADIDSLFTELMRLAV